MSCPAGCTTPTLASSCRSGPSPRQVCAPSNSALDEIVLRLITVGLTDQDGRVFTPNVVRPLGRIHGWWYNYACCPLCYARCCRPLSELWCQAPPRHLQADCSCMPPQPRRCAWACPSTTACRAWHWTHWWSTAWAAMAARYGRWAALLCTQPSAVLRAPSRLPPFQLARFVCPSAARMPCACLSTAPHAACTSAAPLACRMWHGGRRTGCACRFWRKPT